MTAPTNLAHNHEQPPPPGPDRANPRHIAAWCCYDVGNSALPTIVSTFIFAAYFNQAVVKDETLGTSIWGYAMAASGILIALLSVTLGPIAEKGGARKPWLAITSALAVVSTALLWFVEPSPAFIVLGIALVMVNTIAFETSMVFYNAMLPDVAPARMLGRVSGWAWGAGYGGGLICLIVALLLVMAETPPFGLDEASAEPVRVTFLLAALWFAVFTLPLFFVVPDRPRTPLSYGTAIREGLREVRHTLGTLHRFPQTTRFLLAHLVYRDGLNTLFAFGGIYAAVTFGMDTQGVIMLGIGMNVTAGLGALCFGWLDDRIGGRRTVLIALAALTVLGCAILFVEDQKTFFAIALVMGVFFGPAQASSRTLMARLAPPGMETQMFGLFNLSGKVVSFMGPFLVATLTALAESQRAGMSILILFFLLGIVLLLRVTEPRPGTRGETPREALPQAALSPGALP